MPCWMHQPTRRTVHVHLVAREECPQLAHMALEGRERERLLAEHAAAGEAGAERDAEPPGRDRLDVRDRRGGGDDVAQARDQHAGAEPDAARGARGLGDGDPDVAIESGRVGEPHPVVAEPLGERGVVADVGGRNEGAGETHRSLRETAPGYG